MSAMIKIISTVLVWFSIVAMASEEQLGELDKNLWVAVMKRDVEGARRALEQGANVNQCFYGQTPLMEASKNKPLVIPSPELVRLLIQHGANVVERDNKGQIALDYALKKPFMGFRTPDQRDEIIHILLVKAGEQKISSSKVPKVALADLKNEDIASACSEGKVLQCREFVCRRYTSKVSCTNYLCAWNGKQCGVNIKNSILTEIAIFFLGTNVVIGAVGFSLLSIQWLLGF